MAEPIEMLIGG